MFAPGIISGFIRTYCPAAGLQYDQDDYCGDEVFCFHLIEIIRSNIGSSHGKEEDKLLLKFPENTRVNSPVYSENLLPNAVLFA
jgi:hypothetical protein